MPERLPRGYLPAGTAVLAGWPAFAFARVLRRHLPELLESLDPVLRRPLEESLEALTLAGQAYLASRGTAEPAQTSGPVESKEMSEKLTCEEAAQVLSVSTRMVRKLAEAGRLPGRKYHGCWSLDAAAVTAYHEQKQEVNGDA